LTNEEYVAAFAELQQLLGNIYEAIEQGSPFEWGWPDWRGLMVYGIDHNRVLRTMHILSDSMLENDMITVEKKTFCTYDFNKPQANSTLLLKGFATVGLIIEGLDDKKSTTFTMSYPDAPNVMRVWHIYFQDRLSGCRECGEKQECKGACCWKHWSDKHARLLSHRFVESSALDTMTATSVWTNVKKSDNHAAFLAKTDALPEKQREIHYAMYDDACRVGMWVEPFYDMFGDAIVYAKGTWKSHKRMIVWNNGGITVRLCHAFAKNHDAKITLDTYFPGIFERKRFACGQEKCNAECKHRIAHTANGEEKFCCGYAEFYFASPTHEQAMFVWQLFKLECNVK
jgi:hypothetical protein